MTKLLRAAFFVCAALLAGAQHARADSMTIGGPTCATCQGSTYTLEILGLAPVDLYAADGVNDTYRVALTINTAEYSGTGSRIDEVAVKIASAVDQTSLVNAPGDLSYWNLLTGGLSANGCSGTGSGFECTDWKVGSPGGANLADSNLFTWTLRYRRQRPALRLYQQQYGPAAVDQGTIRERFRAEGRSLRLGKGSGANHARVDGCRNVNRSDSTSPRTPRRPLTFPNAHTSCRLCACFGRVNQRRARLSCLYKKTPRTRAAFFHPLQTIGQKLVGASGFEPLTPAV